MRAVGTLSIPKVSHIFVRKEINPYLVIRASVLVILQVNIVSMLSTSQVPHIFVRTVGTQVVRASMLVILQISIVGTLSTLVASGDITSEILVVRASMLVVLRINSGSSISPTFHGDSRRG